VQRTGDELRYPTDTDTYGFEYTGSFNQVTYDGDVISDDYFILRGLHIASILSAGTISVIGRFKFDITRGSNVIFRMTHYHIATNTPQSNALPFAGIVLQRGDIIRLVVDHSLGSASTYYASMRVIGNKVQNL